MKPRLVPIPTAPRSFKWILAVLALAFCSTEVAVAQTGQLDATNSIQSTRKGDIVLPPSVPDPFEPVNRVVWEFNKGVMIGVVQPTSKVYRRIIIKPVRTGIRNAGRNIRYPGRLVNNLLQAQWTGAGNESLRFLCNSVVGVGGLFDVASKWRIPRSDEDFGLTFGSWGWKPKAFLMLPIGGPSNERDGLGLIGDTAANPLTWVDSPYSYISSGISYNGLTDTVDDSVRFAQSETDPYSLIQYAWTFARENQVVDFQVKGEQDPPSLETLQSVFFTFQNSIFPERGKTRSVLIPGTGKKLKFTYWLQSGQAPVVYIVPGLGSHRLAGPALALAQLVYGQGFSAVCVSSAFHPEFMEHASTAAMPGYTPVDANDLHIALTEMDRKLERQYPNRLGSKALMGYSMGAFHSLFIAATQSADQAPLIKFDRYVAINPPVRLLHAVSKLDEFFQAPLEISDDERTENIRNTFLKVAALSKTSLAPHLSLPFNAIESRFLIGVAFRFTLRDVIFSSQQRTNQGVLQQPVRKMRRYPIYKEILQYSYGDYLQKFVTPYYQSRGTDLSAPDALAEAGDLRAYAAELEANPNVRLIVNRDDFLVTNEDLEWFRTTFNSRQLKVFDKGGHLGNLNHPDVQKAILGAFEDLKRPEQ